ncbi:MAG: MBL fold metallo-hydrolase [Oligoflexales bacterium]
MKLKMWGTRGSLPRPTKNDELLAIIDDLAKTAEKSGLSSIGQFRTALRDGDLGAPLTFGGHTTCNEIRHKQQSFLVDMGTGITDAGYDAIKMGRNEFTIFQTHLHWDHLMGMPFFVPIYMPGTKITIYHVHPHAPEHIQIQFNGINFPLKWENLSAEIEFKKIKLYQKLEFGDVEVSPFALDHPGGCFGYRFDAGGKSIAIGVDGEYKRTGKKELGKDLPFYQNLDLLVFDGQYDLDELASRFDWGHSSPPIGVDLSLREGIRNLVLTHHDPRSSEQKSMKMLEHARAYLKSQLQPFQKQWEKLGQPNGPNIIGAFDGFEIDLSKL